jgi:hypothetical protein
MMGGIELNQTLWAKVGTDEVSFFSLSFYYYLFYFIFCYSLLDK